MKYIEICYEWHNLTLYICVLASETIQHFQNFLRRWHKLTLPKVFRFERVDIKSFIVLIGDNNSSICVFMNLLEAMYSDRTKEILILQTISHLLPLWLRRVPDDVMDDVMDVMESFSTPICVEVNQTSKQTLSDWVIYQMNIDKQW